MKRLVMILSMILLSLSLVACGGEESEESSAPVPGTDYVLVEDTPPGAEDARTIQLDFTPETIIPNEITMKPGEKILFEIKNTDLDGEHNFLGADVGLPEILVHAGQTVKRVWHAPDTPGTYEPLCTLHPWIKMTFVIEE